MTHHTKQRTVRSTAFTRKFVLPLSVGINGLSSRNGGTTNFRLKAVLRTAVLRATVLTLLLAFVSTAGLTVPAQRPRPRAQTDTWRNAPPKADAPRTFKLPASRETRLDNGLTLVSIEDHRTPIVTILLGIPLRLASGNIDELTKQVALAEATAELITEGAGSRTSEQVAREVETLGGRLFTTANDDYAEISVTVVAENVDRMLDLVGDVLLRPTYPESEVALYKRNRIQKLVVQRQDPAFLAGEQFDRVVFGEHPYAISAPTPASIDAIDREKIERFYKTSFGPRGAVAVFAGDFDAARIETKAREVLGVWKSPETDATDAQPRPDFPSPAGRRVYLINRPGSEQADFRVGALAVKRSDPDYFPLLVANAVLGAGTGSRLFLNIRERKGYAYDVFSSTNVLREGGTFYGGAETRTAVTVAAIKEMLAEFDRLRNELVPAAELEGAKNYLNGLFSLTLSTQGGVTERILQMYMLGLSRSYLEAYRARIADVTADQVRRAAQRYLLTDRPAVVVVGDASKLARTLQTIGAVQVLNIDGKAAKQSQP